MEHNLESLKGLVDEAILIVGFRKETVEEALGREFHGIKLTYTHQKEQLGTCHALMAAEPHLDKDVFIVMNGDDLYSRENIKALLRETPSLLTQ